MNATPKRPDFDRATVLQILESAFYRCAEQDYATGRVINEEDVRASVYRYVRNSLDLVPQWRVFTNLSSFSSPGTDHGFFKPDLVFFHSPDDEHSPRVEIFAEIKHWPDRPKIEADLAKLAKLHDIYQPEMPDVAFFAIVGTNLPADAALALACDLKRQHPNAHIWLKPHEQPDGPLYKGPWDRATRLDPWRKRLRHLK